MKMDGLLFTIIMAAVIALGFEAEKEGNRK